LPTELYGAKARARRYPFVSGPERDPVDPYVMWCRRHAEALKRSRVPKNSKGILVEEREEKPMMLKLFNVKEIAYYVLHRWISFFWRLIRFARAGTRSRHEAGSGEVARAPALGKRQVNGSVGGCAQRSCRQFSGTRLREHVQANRR
jgi:hypothetical protein